MTVAVRSQTFQASASSSHTFNRGAQQAGDVMFLLAGGGNHVTSTIPDMESLNGSLGQEAQGAAFRRPVADGESGTNLTVNWDGGDPHGVLAVTVEPGDYGVAATIDAQRVGAVGASYAASSVTINRAVLADQLQIVYVFCRNTATLPTSDLGAPTHSATLAGSSMAAWVVTPGERVATTIGLPSGRSGHYIAVVTVRALPYIPPGNLHVRNVAVTQGSGSVVDVALPTRQPGDSLYVFYAGEGAVNWTGAYSRSGHHSTSFQTGAVFQRVATGGSEDDLTLNLSGAQTDHTVIAVATAGRTYLDVNGWNAQSGSYAAETFTADYDPKPANRVLHFLSARNPVGGTPPSVDAGALLGSGNLNDGAVAGLWLVKPEDAGAALHLPQRQGSFWLTARLYQAVTTSVAGEQPFIPKATQSGPNLQVSTKSYKTRTYSNAGSHIAPTAADHLALQAEVRAMPPNVDAIGGSPEGSAGMSTDVNYSASLTPAITTLYAQHNFAPFAVHRKVAPDTGDTGQLLWSPDAIPTAERPVGNVGWEWLDGTPSSFTRPCDLVSVLVESATGSTPAIDFTASPDAPISAPSKLWAQTNNLTWDTISGGYPALTDWTPTPEVPVADLTSINQAVVFDALPLMDSEGRAAFWTETPPSVAPADPASQEGMRYGYTVDGQGYYTVTYVFYPPPFRWLMAVDEIVVDGSSSSVRWWDGAALQAATVVGWWDGSAVQPLTLNGWWDGSSVQPVT